MKLLRTLSCLICLLACASSVFATELKLFDNGSLASIKRSQKAPFLLVLWSLDCPPCYKELKLLGPWSEKNPTIPVVLVSADPLERQQEAVELLNSFKLEKLESWIFGVQSHAMLRHSIDPTWYGELPRSYLYDTQLKAHAHSGLMTQRTLDKIATAFSLK